MPKVMAQPSANEGRGRRGRRTSSTLAEINVIPLVDVMLVLLIIFMVAAPMLQRGVEVNLPVARQTQKMTEERIYITVPLSYRQGSQGLSSTMRRCRSSFWPSARGRRCSARISARCFCAATAR